MNLVAVLPRKDAVASQQIRSAFEPRVSLSHCIYREQFQEPASSYIIKSQATGSRTIVNYNELREMTIEEFMPIADDLGTRSTWFHFEVCLSHSERLPVRDKAGRPRMENSIDAHPGTHSRCDSSLHSVSEEAVSFHPCERGGRETGPIGPPRACRCRRYGILLQVVGAGQFHVPGRIWRPFELMTCVE